MHNIFNGWPKALFEKLLSEQDMCAKRCFISSSGTFTCALCTIPRSLICGHTCEKKSQMVAELYLSECMFPQAQICCILFCTVCTANSKSRSRLTQIAAAGSFSPPKKSSEWETPHVPSPCWKAPTWKSETTTTVVTLMSPILLAGNSHNKMGTATTVLTLLPPFLDFKKIPLEP